VSYVASEAGSVRTTVKVAGGSTVASFTGSMPPGAGSVTWDGRTDADAFVTDGTYSVSLQPIDRAGNKGASLATAVVAYGALGYVKTSVTAFHSRDLDRYAPSTKLSWRLLAPATVTWQVVDGTGRAVITRYEDRALPAGSYAWTWNGKLPDGRFAPSGPYWSRVTATDGTTTVTQSAKFQIAAFRVFLSDTTPSRGQLITAKILTTEPLRANPKLIYTQPGRSPVTLSTVRLSTSSYKVTFRLSTKGSVGPLVISIAGTDRAGGRNRAKVSFAME
jgi:flagellar hook assembly protein FlgD